MARLVCASGEVSPKSGGDVRRRPFTHGKMLEAEVIREYVGPGDDRVMSTADPA